MEWNIVKNSFLNSRNSVEIFERENVTEKNNTVMEAIVNNTDSVVINKYLRITDIDDVSRKFDTDNLTSPDTELAAVENYRLVDGDILFARTGASVGKSYIYRVSDGLVYFAGFLIRAKIKPEYDAEFVFQNTLSESYEKYVQITSQRSGQPGVNAQEYSDYVFYLPTYDEQQKIGAFLRNLDNFITLHQRGENIYNRRQSW